MSSRLQDWAAHIVKNIDRISEYLGSSPNLEKLENPLVRDAVERCLERISEAVARLHRAGVELEVLAPEVPWVDIRNFGNIVRHEYDGVDPDVIRDTVADDLPMLRAAAVALRSKL